MLTEIEILVGPDGKSVKIKAIVGNGWALHKALGEKNPRLMTITHVATGLRLFTGQGWIARRGFRALLTRPKPSDDPQQIVDPWLKELVIDLKSAPVYDVHRYAKWSIHIVYEDEDEVSIDDLWPDGDAPLEPSEEDVRSAYLATADVPQKARIEVRPVDLEFAKRLADATLRARRKEKRG